jgi:hypothetical protein
LATEGQEMTKRDVLVYEVAAAKWPEWIPATSWLSGWASRYFAWKVNRKWRRYEYVLARQRFFGSKQGAAILESLGEKFRRAS